MDNNLLELPFDQYQRYRDIKEVADNLRGNKPFKILDIGGNPGIIRDFLTKDKATIVDVVDADIEDYVKADGSKLPFDDNSFDLVCSIDTLEHVDSKKREKFLEEMARVSSDYIILICPFEDGPVKLAEEVAYDFYESTFDKGWDVLGEHLDNGLPDLEETKGFFEKRKMKPVVIPSGYIYNWLLMQIASIHSIALPDSQKLIAMVNRFYNENHYESDHRNPSYRKIIVAGKKTKISEELVKKFESQKEKQSDFFETFSTLMAVIDFKYKNNLTKNFIKEIKETHKILKDKDVHIRNLEKIINDQTQHLKNLEEWASKIQSSKTYKVYSSIRKLGAGSKNDK